MGFSHEAKLQDSKTFLKKIAKAGVSLGLLAIVWWAAVRRQNPAEILAGVNVRDLALALVIFVAGQVVAGLRLHIVLVELHRRHNWRDVLRAHFVGLWFNQVLPTGFGGDVVKVLTLRRAGDTFRVIRSVAAARVYGLSALLAFAILGAPFFSQLTTDPRPFWAVAIVAGLGLIGLAGAVGLASQKVLARPMQHVKGGVLIVVLRDIRRVAIGRIKWEMVLTSAIVVLTVCLCFWFLSTALGHPLTLASCLLAVPPLIVSMQLPVSFGGWGIRELGASILLPLVGVPSAIAVLVSVLYGLVIAASGLIGLVVWHLPITRNNPVGQEVGSGAR